MRTLRFLPSFLIICTLLFGFGCQPDAEPMETDVLVIGGSTSGTSAGIQAARSGAKTLLIEPTPWLGGMLTSAGVGATDGNHRLPSGIWGEFRQKLYDYYGGPDSVFTGWVSNTLFEPHIGARMWKELADNENLLTIIHGYRLAEIQKMDNKVTGALFEDGKGNKIRGKK